jgi:Flp pilus assembly protein TadD
MRRRVIHLILSASLVIHFAKPVIGKESSASLMAQALEKIQAGNKAQALKLLSRAYESSQDPEEIKAIAALIIDTSGSDYPKRENFLIYLTRHARDSADHWKWLKELGDRHFDRGQFDKAEEGRITEVTRFPRHQDAKTRTRLRPEPRPRHQDTNQAPRHQDNKTKTKI